jgi:type I restriction enzyme S subunit
MRKMKDSGIEWIGEIPQEWDVRRIKFTLDAHSSGAWGTNEGEDEADIICVRVADFDYSQLTVDFHDKMTVRSYSAKTITESSIRSGDILLEKSGGGETTPVGRSVLFESNEPMMCANFIEWLRPNRSFDSRFLTYWLSAAYTNGFSKRNIKQTTGIQNLDVPAFLSEKIASPDVANQVSIADYLDQKCAEIDAIIAAKEKTNELLKERRQSIIYEAVTKGLDPTVPMRDSGVEWIGAIPESWEIERLKYHTKFNPATDIPEYEDDQQVSFLPMECLRRGTHTSQVVDYEKVKKGYVIFQDNDILMAKVTPCLENGNIAIAQGLIDGIGFGSTEINVIRCTSIHREYLFYMLQCKTYIERAVADMYGVAGLKRLNPSFIPNTKYPIPSSAEQERIAEYLNRVCGEFDALIVANNVTIEKLKEYRQSVIYEAVTGKVEI